MAVYVVDSGEYGAVSPPPESPQPQLLLAARGKSSCCCRLAKLLLLLIGLTFLVLLIGTWLKRQSSSDVQEEEMRWKKWLDDANFTVKEEPLYDRFIFTEPLEAPIGNQMYRFASLFAMGQLLNRTPVFLHNDFSMRKMEAAGLANIFQRFYERIYFLRDEFNQTEEVRFARSCCDYHDPKKLEAHKKARGLMLTGDSNLENHKYFHHMRPQILELFQFHTKMVKNVTALKKQMFSTSDYDQPSPAPHNLCVHTRSSDFAHLGVQQIGAAIDRVMALLPRMTKTKARNFTLVLFGEQKQFLQSIKVANGNESVANTVYVLHSRMGPEQRLCLARLSCDSLLLTDSLSPFAFWMGYLQPETRPVFFVRKRMTLPSVEQKELDTLELLPSDWLPIEESWMS